MTRINVVPVEELSDQWLLAEYHELPRVIKGDFDLRDAPNIYCLGKGHVKWAKKHSRWLLRRYLEVTWELADYRGYKVNYPFCKLYGLWESKNNRDNDRWYEVNQSDIKLNCERLIEKYRAKPGFYKWTGREKPEWLKEE